MDLTIASYQSIRGRCLTKIKSNWFIEAIYDIAFNYVIALFLSKNKEAKYFQLNEEEEGDIVGNEMLFIHG